MQKLKTIEDYKKKAIKLSTKYRIKHMLSFPVERAERLFSIEVIKQSIYLSDWQGDIIYNYDFDGRYLDHLKIFCGSLIV